MEKRIRSLIKQREKTYIKKRFEKVPAEELRCIEQILYELKNLLVK